VYTILNKDNDDYKLSYEQKRELDKRLKLHEKGLSPSIPWKKSLKSIRSQTAK
jgi:hypothetical protein